MHTDGKLLPTCLLLFGVLLILAIYIGLRADEQTGDSLSYVHAAKTGINLYHPHHLIFAPAVRVLQSIVGAFTPLDTLVAAQIHNVIWAGITLWFMFSLIFNLTKSYGISTLCAMLLAASNGFWSYATLAEVYVPAAGAVAILMWLTAKPESAEYSPKLIFLIGIFLAVATLYHQSCILLLPSLMAAFLIRDHRRFVRNSVRVSLVSFLILAASYLYGYYQWVPATSEQRGLLDYLFLYNSDLHSNWGTVENVNLQGVALLTKSFLRNFVFLPAGSTALLLVLMFLFVAGSAVVFYAAFRGTWIKRTAVSAVVFASIWLVSDLAFVLWWLPGENELLIILLPTFILLVAIALNLMLKSLRTQAQRRLTYGVLCIAIVVIALTNFDMSVQARASSKGRDYTVASVLDSCVDRQCVILTDWQIEQNLRYYFDRQSAYEVSLLMTEFQKNGEIKAGAQLKSSRCMTIVCSDLATPVDSLIHDLSELGAVTVGFAHFLLYDNTGEIRRVRPDVCGGIPLLYLE